MGGCVAEFCNNSSTKGYIMKVFPRDSQRRAEWTKNVDRKNWTPTDNSYLCEVHFAPEMWERRVDNKPKLKPYAILTIFGFFIKEKTFFPRIENTVPVIKDVKNNSNNLIYTDSEKRLNEMISSVQSEEIQCTTSFKEEFQEAPNLFYSSFKSEPDEYKETSILFPPEDYQETSSELLQSSIKLESEELDETSSFQSADSQQTSGVLQSSIKLEPEETADTSVVFETDNSQEINLVQSLVKLEPPEENQESILFQSDESQEACRFI